MATFYGDFKAGQVVRCRFNTVNASGVPTTLSSGAVIVSKDGTDVTPTGGVTLTTDAGSVTGRHVVAVDMTVDPATFTAGSEYAVRLSGTANVGGTSVVGVVVGEWSVANRAVAPQTGDAYAKVANLPTLPSGTVQAGATSTVIVLQGSSLGTTSGAYKGRPLRIALAGGSELFTDPCSAHAYSAPNHTFTFAAPQSATPAGGEAASVVA